MDIPSFKEDRIPQIPALKLLMNTGCNYLTLEEALLARGGKSSSVILENVLEKQPRQINAIQYKGNEYSFSNVNITTAINPLKNMPYDDLIRTNEKIYDLLSLGKSFEETILGSAKNYDLKYVDWENADKNVFHLTEEFEVLQSNGKAHRRKNGRRVAAPEGQSPKGVERLFSI
jgi:type I restriction enzyme R subunit